MHAGDSIATWVERHAHERGDQCFARSVEDGSSISYGALERLCGQLSCALQRRGIGRGDRVLVLSGNSLELLVTYVGILAHGATVCTVQLEMNRPHLEHIIGTLAPKLVLHALDSSDPLHGMLAARGTEVLALGRWSAQGQSTGWFAELEASPSACAEPERDAQGEAIFYTSGTEARPKGVVITARELATNARAVAAALELSASDRVLEFRDFNWLSAQVLSCLAPLAVGATLLFAQKLSHSRYFAWLRDERATLGACTPAALAMFVNSPVPAHKRDLPCLRFVTSSSAPLALDTWQRFEERYGIPIAQGYGASEVGWIALSNEHSRKLGTVGRPLSSHALRIVDASGHALPPGAIGEVELGADDERAYRYVGEDGTAHVFARGRLRTGDLGVLDEDGSLRLVGRTKELIIRGGVNVSPREIDEVLLTLAGVAEAAALAVPHPIYGEEVACWVVPQPGVELSEEAVLAHCRVHLPAFRAPKQAFVSEEPLPRNARGKLDRTELARRVGSLTAART